MNFEERLRLEHSELLPYLKIACDDGYKLSQLSVDLLLSYVKVEERKLLSEKVANAKKSGCSKSVVSVGLIEDFLDMASSVQTYALVHAYDWGGTSYIQGFSNPVRAATYCEFLAEKRYGEEKGVTTEGIASALIEFYGFGRAPARAGAVRIDLHYSRGSFCGAPYSELMGDSSLYRAGLVEYLEQYVEG